MNTVQGDIIEMANRGDFDVIVHGMNCENKINGAVAKLLIEKYPQVALADDATKNIEPEKKLGTIVSTTVASVDDDSVIFTIVNAYTQKQARSRDRNKVLVDYDAIRSIFQQIARHYEGCRIGYPKIGDNARGDWARISQIIDTELAGFQHSLVELPPKPAVTP